MGHFPYVELPEAMGIEIWDFSAHSGNFDVHRNLTFRFQISNTPWKNAAA